MKINCDFDFYEGNRRFTTTEMKKKNNIITIDYCNNKCNKDKNWRWTQLGLKDSNRNLSRKFNDKNLTIYIKWKGIWIEKFKKNNKGECKCEKRVTKNYKIVFQNLSCYNKIKNLLTKNNKSTKKTIKRNKK
jgi:hypothetical protein